MTNFDIMHSREEKLAQFGRLLDVMDSLREKCPWNAAQTADSIRPMTVEEVYELSDAIIRKDDSETCKELGDLLYHIVFYSRIAQESGRFDIADVLDRICEKMIFRHPHVFAEGKQMTAKEIADTWELVKAKEKGGNRRIMDGIPESMPPMLKALSLQEKARGAGFDWEDRRDVWDKVMEEQRELQTEFIGYENAADPDDREAAFDRLEGEFGDLLFALINAARLYGIDPDKALDRTNKKFRTRFTYMEEQTIRKGINLKDLSLAEMDAVWDEAKARGL